MSVKIVLNNVRLSYEHLFAPDGIKGSEPKYSASWIIPKDSPRVEDVRRALNQALDEKFPGARKNGKWPGNKHCPLADGDELADEHPEYAGSYVLKSSSKVRPVVYDRRKLPVSAEDGLIYSGCYCNASLAAAGFDAQMKSGVTVYLNGVQFVRDGDRLSGYDASNDFEALDDDEELL